MSDDPHRPILHVETTGPTPRHELLAARLREGWRAFWRYRGEELASFSAWTRRHPLMRALAALAASTTLLAAIVVGTAYFGGMSRDRACDRSCEMVGYGQSVHRDGECFCVTPSGARPWPASEPELPLTNAEVENLSRQLDAIERRQADTTEHIEIMMLCQIELFMYRREREDLPEEAEFCRAYLRAER